MLVVLAELVLQDQLQGPPVVSSFMDLTSTAPAPAGALLFWVHTRKQLLPPAALTSWGMDESTRKAVWTLGDFRACCFEALCCENITCFNPWISSTHSVSAWERNHCCLKPGSGGP